ncbi:MAG: hypothetical protein GX066_07465 [Clostridiaceae bacterium]|nr:hypothetical protein [Clostridiaceae bacterium]
MTQKEDIDALINSLTKSYEYRNERFILVRDLNPENVLSAVAGFLSIENVHFVKIKYSRQVSQFRAISAFLLRCLCDYRYKDICKVFGNICQS